MRSLDLQTQFHYSQVPRAACACSGGDQIPLDYAGQDASEYWNEIHGHVKAEIFEDLATRGESGWTGLETFPKVVGLADGPAPKAAMGSASGKRNWAGNVVWKSAVVTPATCDELAAAMRSASSQMRALGRGHSFTACCDTEGTIVSLAKLNAVVEFDEENGLLTVEAGITYTKLFQFLKNTKWALANVASLPHVTVGGAFSTGTHGSSGLGPDGRALLGNLSSQATRLRFMAADGKIVTYEKGVDAEFDAARTGIGCLGVLVEATLQLVPTYNVAQVCYRGMAVEALIVNFMPMLHSCDSFSALIDFPADEVYMFVSRQRVAAGDTRVPEYPPTLWGGTISADGFTMAGSSNPGTHTAPWHEVLFYHVSGGDEGKATDLWKGYTELQMEYFVDLADYDAALRAAWKCARQWGDCTETDRLFRACELRVVRADSADSLLSPVRGRDSLVIHFSISTNFGEMVESGFGNGTVGQRALDCCTEMESALAPFAPRPHWGKLFTMGADALSDVYGSEAIRQFRKLANKHDPEGKFRNDWVTQLLFD